MNANLNHMFKTFKMNTFQIFALLLICLINGSLGATKSKCDVVHALRTEGVPNSDMRDWLCLVAHESSYRYDIKHINSDGSTDFGIFQLNDNYMCGNAQGTSSTTCWRIRTYGCADACSTFADSNISNDASCAVRVKNCDGFKRWYGWLNHCSDVSGSQYDYSHC
ncbi:lysozyme-like [Ruditapes philippinarum]|uniref:lysozyme-like n=1 Tax=Ruditapes philippinarum TaxID=129788 RepID=UPI00295B8DC8|nr:lysozyme-like [Ruditapes philippinarum]